MNAFENNICKNDTVFLLLHLFLPVLLNSQHSAHIASLQNHLLSLSAAVCRISDTGEGVKQQQTRKTTRELRAMTCGQ